MSPPARILIVEDEEVLANNLKCFLGRHTPDIRIAPDAETAMEMLKSFTPEVVVMDYALPGIDGLRAYGDIVQASPQKPSCVMISGYPTELMFESASQRGIHYLLCKPFGLAELQQAVNMSLEEENAVSIEALSAWSHENSPVAANRRCVEERRCTHTFRYLEDRRLYPGRRERKDPDHSQRNRT